MLGGIDDPHLIVSTKYTLGDFYSHLPLNADAGRRASTAASWSSRPGASSRGSARCPTTSARCTGRRCARSWPPTRTSRASGTGPRTAARCAPGRCRSTCATGFWQLYDLNTYAIGRLAWDPDADPAQVTADWVRPDVLAPTRPRSRRSAQALALSREAITKGLYIGPYADQLGEGARAWSRRR